jgi:hypothetical protein
MLDIECDIQFDILVGFSDFPNIHSTLVHIKPTTYIGHISHNKGKGNMWLPKQKKLLTKNVSYKIKIYFIFIQF